MNRACSPACPSSCPRTTSPASSARRSTARWPRTGRPRRSRSSSSTTARRTRRRRCSPPTGIASAPSASPTAGSCAPSTAGWPRPRGDYVALLDADDEWPTDRLRRHVAFLEAHPHVGLVHGDMTIVDADGAVIAPSFFEAHNTQLASGRVLGRLLAGNFVSGGACTFRAALLPAIHPIPDDAAYPDWWIAATVAAVAEIDVVPGCANLYRYHGANMGLGSGAEDMHRILGKEIPWRRWMLRHLVARPDRVRRRPARGLQQLGVRARHRRPRRRPGAQRRRHPDRVRARAQRAGRRRGRRRPARRRPRPRGPPAPERHRRGPVERRRAPATSRSPSSRPRACPRRAPPRPWPPARA